MFTGLIQGLGQVEAATHSGRETRFAIRTLFELADALPGESIAVNGVCLTVEEPGANRFTAYASGETMGLTNLGALNRGATVNLERALSMGDRLGGHLVSGHVDCLAVVAGVAAAGQSTVYTLDFPGEFGRLVVPKGSVALDGVSLTVNECGQDFLTVNIIPSTKAATTIASWRPGTRVNMETDLIGKYVARMLGPWTGGESGNKPGLSLEFLREHGF
ncbi:MAG: riboflavin synthase [Desulfovibrionaceae bacterium]|nr:riboflavin synthase [Desulfovibrionaceae bacterium]MBF0513243.1 riboflavin synthase [Desulfovibrionaceae bacterium]